MEWLKENTNIWIAGILLIICFFWALSSTVALNKLKGELGDLKGSKFSLEEQYDSLSKAKLESDEKLIELTKTLEQERKVYADTLTELNQEKLNTKALKAELEKTVKLNEDLQAQLKKAGVK